MTNRLRAALVAALALLAPTGAVGQTVYVAPEIGRSEIRGTALGVRVGAEVVGGLDLVFQALTYFPDESGSADPGVLFDRSIQHLSLNAIYVFDRVRALSPYVGGGARWGHGTITVVADGRRAHEVLSGFDLHLVAGLGLPRLPADPFVELRRGDGGWLWTVGGRWVVRR